MRKIIVLPLFLLGVLAFFSSCKKEAVSNTPASIANEMVDVKITANQPYQMDLTSLGTVSIIKQAAHYLVSEAQVNSQTGAGVYKYVPSAGYVGNDEVQLVSFKSVTTYADGSSSGGCHSSNHSTASIPSTSTVSQNITLQIVVSN
jgi:hypothetical protein